MSRKYFAYALALGLTGCGEMGNDGAPIVPVDPEAGVRVSRITLDGYRYFMNGINLAWNNWSMDLAPDRVMPDQSIMQGYDPSLFESVFESLEAVGGNSLRLWVHCDGAYTPVYDEQGIPIGVPEGTQDNLRDMLSRAAAHRVRILFSLWSFGLNAAKAGHGNVVTDITAIQSYIDNVLTGLVGTAKGSPGLFGWEICNEPQFMTEGYPGGNGDTSPGLPKAAVLRWHAMLAAAIHRADPDALVTTGDMFPEISPTMSADQRNHYSDAALAAAAGGDPLARFDFYELHSYATTQNGLDPTAPWLHDAGWYGLTKPIIIGEFEARGIKSEGWTPERMYLWAHDHGYAGATSWAYLNNRGDHTGTFATATPGIQAVFDADPASVYPAPRAVPDAGADTSVEDVSVDAAPEASTEDAAPDASMEDAAPDQSTDDAAPDQSTDDDAPDQSTDDDAEAGD